MRTEHEIDTELADVLIAISIISKQLANKIRKESSDEEALRTDG